MDTTSTSLDNADDSALRKVVREFFERTRQGQTPSSSSLVKICEDQGFDLQRLVPALKVFSDLAHTLGGQVSSGDSVNSDVPFKLLGDYRLIRRIGTGGMGVVYEAEQISLGRRVAVKILPFASSLDDSLLKRFQYEARAAAGLDHPNIVPVYAIGCEHGVHFYVMKFIEGQDLGSLLVKSIDPADSTQLNISQIWPLFEQDLGEFTDFLPSKNGSLPRSPDVSATRPNLASQWSEVGRKGWRQVRRWVLSRRAIVKPKTRELVAGAKSSTRDRYGSIARWGIEVAKALEYSHSLGVIHRDIKPANLLLDADGRIWVTDFGLAIMATQPALTRTRDFAGTIRYMSPEQASGNRRLIDHRTDIYSLGVSLYEMVTSRPMFTGVDAARLIEHLRQFTPDPLSRIVPDIPADLATIIHKAMETKASDRYQSAMQLREDLQRFLGHKPILAKSPGFHLRCAKFCRRNRLAVQIGVATLIAVSIALAFMSFATARERTRLEQERKSIEQQRQSVAAFASHVKQWQSTSNISFACEAIQKGDFEEAKKRLSELVSDGDDHHNLGFAWNYLWNVSNQYGFTHVLRALGA